MIRTILFDLSEVHLTGMYGAEQPIAEALGRDEDDVWADMQHPALHAMFRGRVPESYYWQQVIESGKYPAEINGLPAEEFLSAAMRNNFRVIPGTAEVILAINRDRYDVVMLSDHAREWVDYIERQFQLAPLFPTRFYSFDIGHTKRQPQSFQHVLRQTGADPQTTLFVDDNGKNIGIAQSPEVGIAYTHRFESPVSLYRSLRSYGIL